MFLFIFNQLTGDGGLNLFKYISCSYLSQEVFPSSFHDLSIQIHLMFLFISISIALFAFSIVFKYISCSYLSQFRKDFVNLRGHSNTSHVLIYLLTSPFLQCFSAIQIHLMFLFIIDPVRPCRTLYRFKYISCSYLSRTVCCPAN